MFPLPRPSSPRHRSASCSTDDHSSKDRHPKLFQRHYAHGLSFSSQSLATSNSHHDDPPTPSMPTHASHTTSARSTPMTSPSTAHSNFFPASISSTTSESVPSAESKYRSEFGMLMPGSSSSHSPIHGSASSRSSHPVSPRSRSTTEPDTQILEPQTPCKRPFAQLTDRPLTAPTDCPPIPPTSSTADSSQADHHTRSQSRLTVSIKNLFSRQALPSPSRFSFNSATTVPPGSEASSSSFHVPAVPGKWSMTPRKSRPPDLEISGSAAAAMPSPGRGSNTALDAHRRYASEVAAKIYNARTGNGLPTSQDGLDGSSRNVPPTRGKDPKTRNVLRRRPSGSAKLLKGRERGMSSPSPRQDEGDADPLHLPPERGRSRQGGVPFPLTPAGAVVEAYKQHELYRDDVLTPPKLSLDDRMSSIGSHDGGYDRDYSEYSPTPYYTLFGSSSERCVRAGGLDDRWAGFDSLQHTFTSSHQPSMSDPGGRSLTRKLSSRWRKVKGGGVAPEESPSCDRGHSKGRPSLQDVWGADKSTSRRAGQSIDYTPNAGDGALATASHARSESKRDESEGPKLWRLMRRISTGGLRDRFQSDKAVPPVPAIPKELLKKTHQDERDYRPVSASRHQTSSPLRDKDHNWMFTGSRNVTVPRPSVAASSPSPNSSDVASAQFFKTQSTRSSISSYGEAVVAPGGTETMLDRHIITPREQLRLGDDHVESDESCLPISRCPHRLVTVSASAKISEDGEGDQVPLPSPRWQTSSGEPPSSGSSRPCSASTSVSGSARGSYQIPGAGPALSRMADGIVSLSPPPRASKNLPRGGGGSVTSSHSHPTAPRQVDGVVGPGPGVARQMDRTPSSRSDMTARFGSPEPGRPQVRDQDVLPTRRQFSFRELDRPRRPPLSEREKADIWNDLLARSDQAGGTLHINGATELLSDNMRLSTYSEV